MTDRFESDTRTVSLLTLASRITGLAREACLSRAFGAGGLMDAFFLAFLVPNLFRRLFGDGALSAAFLPIYSELDRDDPEQARRLASMTLSAMVVVLGAMVVIGELVLLVVTNHADERNLAPWLMMIMLPYMPLVCMVAILGAMLQVHGRFGPAAAAPMVLNGCIIAAATIAGLVLAPEAETTDPLHIGAVAASVVLAGILQMAWALWALRDRDWWRRQFGDAMPAMRTMVRRAGPMILGLGVLQLNVFIDGLIASYPTTFGPTIFGVTYPLQEGAMASLTYAQRLYHFPLGVFGIAVATAIYPILARQTREPELFTATVRRGLRLVLFIGLPASAGLLLVRDPLVHVVLEGGRFTASNTDRVGFVLLGYAPAIWAYAMIHVLTRVFYAEGDARRPVKVAVSIVVLNIVLNMLLIWTPLREAGLAWSTAICSIVQVLVLLLMLQRRTGSLFDRDVRRSWMRTLGITVGMSAAVAVLAALLGPAISWFGAVAQLTALVGLGAVVVGALAALMGMPELTWALGRRTPSG